MRVNVVEDRSTGDYRECRRMLVRMGINEPGPVPGYSGFIGWETPCVLRSGEQIVSFTAGVWHVTFPTPVQMPDKLLAQYTKSGYRPDIEAPRGGRAMLIRSTDGGLTWSKPETLIDSPRDDRHPALTELDGGSVWVVYYDPGKEQQKRTGTWSMRIRINDDKDGLELLPVPGAGAGVDPDTRRAAGPLDADAM